MLLHTSSGKTYFEQCTNYPGALKEQFLGVQCPSGLDHASWSPPPLTAGLERGGGTRSRQRVWTGASQLGSRKEACLRSSFFSLMDRYWFRAGLVRITRM